MDYGALVSRAWQLTWRHKFLWILGLFATSTVGSCSGNAGSSFNWRTDGREVERAFPEAGRAASAFGQWVMANFGLVTAVVVTIALVGVAVLVISFIAQGAMAQATSDLARNRAITLGQAWDAGLRLFWRYVGLWLVLIALGIAVLVIVGIVGFGLFAGAIFGGRLSGPLITVGAVVGALAALVAIPLAVALTIIVAYAQRAIAVENVGPWEALNAGWTLLRRRFGTSLVVWLISVALGIAGAIVVGIVAVLLLIPLGGILLVLILGSGMSVGTIAYGVVALLVFAAVLWGVSGVLNAYFWNLWTLTYLHLTGRMEPAAGTPPIA